MQVDLHPEAQAELRSAALWYDERRPGLGDELVATVAATLRRIGEAPSSFPKWPDVLRETLPIRRALVNRFPYAVAFEVHHPRILVLAVAHVKRRPLYWLARASPD